MVDVLVNEMTNAGINIVRGEVDAIASSGGLKSVTLKDGSSREGYDEILHAIGRKPVTDSLGLDSAGISTTDRGHIVVDKASRTSAADVYAVGDVIGRIDLTPTAIAAGRLLADRLFGGADEAATIMDYDNVPTAVFSHPPLGAVGLTEAEARARHGDDAVTIHKTTFVNMLYSRECAMPAPRARAPPCVLSVSPHARAGGRRFLVEGQPQPKTFAKLVCVGDEQRVVGLHMAGLAVDEILQGFGVAIKMGATKADFDSVVAIHPTSAEELVTIPPWQAKYKLSH